MREACNAEELCEPHENKLIFLTQYLQSALGTLKAGHQRKHQGGGDCMLGPEG